MAEFQEVMRQFDRMCCHYQRKHECPMGCPMNGVNISQCRKIAFECADSVEKTVMAWAAEHPEPVYPTWLEYLCEVGVIPKVIHCNELYLTAYNGIHDNRIPADIAEKLGVPPKPIDYCKEAYRSEDGTMRIRKTPIYPIEPKEDA